MRSQEHTLPHFATRRTHILHAHIPHTTHHNSQEVQSRLPKTRLPTLEGDKLRLGTVLSGLGVNASLPSAARERVSSLVEIGKHLA